MEFLKAGYKVVVPYQDFPWCYHDNDITDSSNYEYYRSIFEREYKEYYLDLNYSWGKGTSN